MMQMLPRGSVLRRAGRRFLLLTMSVFAVGLTLGGCNAIPASVFNPAFVELVDEDGTTGSTLTNAPGHVPIIFVNQTRFSGQMAAYLDALNEERRLSGVDPTVTDLRNLRPRLRVVVRITFENGNTLPFEFTTGDRVVEIASSDTLDTGGDTVAIDPQLTADDLTRMVATCGVTRVEIEGNPQVFVPVFVRTIRVDVGDESGRQTRTLVATDQPQFRPILPDEVDDSLNVTLLRNFGIREAPPPARDLRCGTMVGIVLDGTVAAPFTVPEDEPEDEFIEGQSEVPGFVDTDVQAQASIPGRFTFQVSER